MKRTNVEYKNVEYKGYELVDGTPIMLIHTGEYVYLGDDPFTTLGHILPEDIIAISFSDKQPRKGILNTWELSSRRRRFRQSLEKLRDRSLIIGMGAAVITAGSAIASFFFPPAIAVAATTAPIATGSVVIGAMAGFSESVAASVKYIEFECQAFYNGDNRAQHCTVPVDFLGRMPYKHFIQLCDTIEGKNHTRDSFKEVVGAVI